MSKIRRQSSFRKMTLQNYLVVTPTPRAFPHSSYLLQKMKLSPLLCCLFLALSSASDSCSNCQVSSSSSSRSQLAVLPQAVVTSLSSHLSSLASTELQKLSLETKLCSQLPASDLLGCLRGVRRHWGQVARVLWPGFYDPQVSQMKFSRFAEAEVFQKIYSN